MLAVVLHFVFLSMRKPQFPMEQVQDLPIALTPMAWSNLDQPFGVHYFVDPDLKFIGGITLSSAHPYFGGWSGLAIIDNRTKLLAVSDTGQWMETRLRTEPDGRITGVDSSVIGPIIDADEKPLFASHSSDIEAIAVTDSRIFLSYESIRSGVWIAKRTDSLSQARFAGLSVPGAIADLPTGKGLEALTVIEDAASQVSKIVLIAERQSGMNAGFTPAWIIGMHGEIIEQFELPIQDAFDVSDVAYDPRCGLWILERKLEIPGRWYVRLLRSELHGEPLLANLTLEKMFEADSSGYAIDNMEGVALVANQDASCNVYLISDSNFLRVQKNVLLEFVYH